MLPWYRIAPALLSFAAFGASTQPAGKVLPIEAKVLDIVGASRGLDARLKDIGAKIIGNEIVIELAADVLFDFDKYELKPAARDSLAKVAAFLKDMEKAPASIEGHTDNKGLDAYNQQLSERRANAVREWLTRQGGIAANRLIVRGFGKTRPVVPNNKPDGSDDPAGRQRNRRVEIRLKRM